MRSAGSVKAIVWAALGAGAFAMFVVLATAGCSPSVPSPTESKIAGETTAISVYYPDGEIIIEERQVVPVSDNLPEVAMQRLFAVSPEKEQIAIVLPQATVNSVTVDQGTGVGTIDFSAEVLDFPVEDEQARVVAFGAVLETLRQFPEITSVLITVDGKSSGEVDGRRIEEFWGSVRLPREPLDITAKE
ncbi:MAG: GerMN domain-containing protein [Clostridiales bacterium]|nr:GerMN domain-containing protein [Clostridiales bacterium]